VSRPISVWASAQTDSRAQRRGRYVPDTTAHPARMLPAVAAAAISGLTEPGELVFDPMCGAGTTLVEAMHLGRAAVGVDIEPRWSSLARDNIAHTRRLGVGGYGHVITGDARSLPTVLPPQYLDQMRGQVKLVLTSPPYGAATHGVVSTRPGEAVSKRDFRYSRWTRPANLAYQPLQRLLGGLTRILAGCLPLLAPDGYVVLIARPWRDHGELVDLPGAICHAAEAAGLRPVQRCVALLAGIRDGELVSRASFFQRTAVGKARAAGRPWHLISHEDVLLFRPMHTANRRRLAAAPPAVPAHWAASSGPATPGPVAA
jgi:modification methylase